MAETRRLWAGINRLKRTRPVVFCDPENGWNEIITETQMECRGRLARRWEMDLRKEIFWGEVMGDDKPVEPWFNVPYTVWPDDWGLSAVYRKGSGYGSYVWEGAIKDYAADLKRMHSPPVRDRLGNDPRLRGHRQGRVGRHSARAAEGHLVVVVGVDLAGRHLARAAKHALRLHRASRRVEGVAVDHLAGTSREARLPGGQRPAEPQQRRHVRGLGRIRLSPTSCRKPTSREQVRTRDLWGFTESQETVNVSPAMYEEFVFPCEKPIMERFGLNCYGCCEPVHGRWHVVRRHPRLRRVSCSPWVDVEKMAGNLGDKYIFSMKPNPAALAVPEMDDGGAPPRNSGKPGKDPGLRRGTDYERQPYAGPPAGERRHLVPHRQGRSGAEMCARSVANDG